ncbi:thioredoxin family protein [Halobacillus rhizosphaerae]|uniref:thioredoxin family protein n=1 Tax=Halobacillus rhizosphaerae TaxID=3064889 RepID=UPI00398B3D3A
MQQLDNKEVNSQLAKEPIALTFIHSPFCGTCHLARKMLTTIELSYNKEVFYELNASLHPALMQDYQVESVPCLLVTQHGKLKEKVYAFHSVPFMYEKTADFVTI